MPRKINHNNTTGNITKNKSFKGKSKDSNLIFLITTNNMITEMATTLMWSRLKLISHRNIPAVIYKIFLNKMDCCCSPMIKKAEKKVINKCR